MSESETIGLSPKLLSDDFMLGERRHLRYLPDVVTAANEYRAVRRSIFERTGLTGLIFLKEIEKRVDPTHLIDLAVATSGDLDDLAMLRIQAVISFFRLRRSVATRMDARFRPICQRILKELTSTTTTRISKLTSKIVSSKFSLSERKLLLLLIEDVDSLLDLELPPEPDWYCEWSSGVSRYHVNWLNRRQSDIDKRLGQIQARIEQIEKRRSTRKTTEEGDIETLQSKKYESLKERRLLLVLQNHKSRHWVRDIVGYMGHKISKSIPNREWVMGPAAPSKTPAES